MKAKQVFSPHKTTWSSSAQWKLFTQDKV
jgi:hypothetical protein